MEWLLTERVARLAPATPQALADAILVLLQDDLLRERQVKAALDFAQTTDWLVEIKSIEAAFRRGLGAPEGVDS